MFSPMKPDKDPVTMASKILSFCFAVLIAAILLTLAVELLARIWVWLVAGALVVAVIWLIVLLYRWRHGRW